MLPRSPHDVSGQAWMFASLAVRMLRLSPHIMSGQVGPSPVPDVFFGLYTCCRDVFFFFGVETEFSTLPVRAEARLTRRSRIYAGALSWARRGARCFGWCSFLFCKVILCLCIGRGEELGGGGGGAGRGGRR